MRRTKYPKISTIELDISNFAEGIDASTDENITDFNKAVNSYNFEFKNGALVEGIGFENLTIPSYHDEGSVEVTAQFQLDQDKSHNFVKIAHFKSLDLLTQKREDRIFAVASDNIPCFTRLITTTPNFIHLRNIFPTECPKIANYHDGERDCLLFYSDNEHIYSWNAQTEPIQHSSTPLIHDFCEFNDEVVAVPSGERLSLRIEKINLLQWSATPSNNSKIIVLDSERGYINKLLAFNGYLFAVRDFGITRLDGNFSVSHLLCSGSRIYANTACVCGNRGLVLCKDGIYEFNNISAQKLNVKINRFLKGVSNQNAVAAYRNGIYYLACRLNFDDNQQVGCESGNYVNNALICFDTQTNQYSICRGLDIIHLCTIQYNSADKLLACFNGEHSSKIGQLTTDGKIFNTSQTKFWSSPFTDLGYSNKIKYVKEISLLSLYDIKLKIFSEIESREFDIKGSNVISRVPVRIKGKRIGISITSTTEKAYVSNFKLIANLIDNEYV
ncbi:MAG TPA: hypothetical protein DCO89_01355 [Clostridiales bacterium]|nr:hypothetical protein [Clostridiales bacterium]